MIDSMDLVIDLETTGIEAGCAILSIGACTLDMNHKFYSTISHEDCLKHGLKDNYETIAWWNRQSKEIREEAYSGTTSLIQALGEFHDFFRRIPAKKVFVWGNGADFDLPILKKAYSICNMSTPWLPYNGRCYRTMKNNYSQVAAPPIVGSKHNALDDAVFEATHLMMIMRERKKINDYYLSKAVESPTTY
jgi:exodeoxyribonuclease VIII